MSCCSAPEAEEKGGSAPGCPHCGVDGRRVDPITLKALLTGEALRRGIPRSPRFCATERCPVVYFGERGTTSFTESDLTVSVHAKHPLNDTVPVCYCFGFDAASIARAPAGAVRAEVAAEVRAGHCACEVRNPKGACCLGDIVAAERRLRG